MTIGATTTHEVSIDALGVDASAVTAATWINTAKIKDLTFPEETRETSEDSYLDSPDGYKEFVAGMIDGGEVGLVLKWNLADVGQIAINDKFSPATDGIIYGRMTFPNGSTFVYKAVLTGRGVEVPKNETITQSFKLKVSGKPAWSA